MCIRHTKCTLVRQGSAVYVPAGAFIFLKNSACVFSTPAGVRRGAAGGPEAIQGGRGQQNVANSLEGCSKIGVPITHPIHPIHPPHPPSFRN